MVIVVVVVAMHLNKIDPYCRLQYRTEFLSTHTHTHARTQHTHTHTHT